MFVWRSDELLKNYGSGKLIALATDANAARLAIRAHFLKWVKAEREWCLGDEDDMGALAAKLDRDLAQEPTEEEVLYINGSE
jgi:hypothetical protein